MPIRLPAANLKRFSAGLSCHQRFAGYSRIALDARRFADALRSAGNKEIRQLKKSCLQTLTK
jgi:hypothetical protein